MRVTVHSTTDRIEAHALLALLQSEGIEAELAGVVDAARVGVGETVLPVHIEVSAEDESRAREVLSTPPPQAEPSEDRPRHKKPIIAVGVSVVWPGLGHLYAQRPYTALLLGLGVLGSIAAAGGNTGLGAAYVLLVIADAFFGRRAVLALNAGKYRSGTAQLAAGVALVGGSYLLVGSVPLFERYQRAQRERELSRIAVTCPAGRVIAANVGDELRDVEVSALVAVRQRLMAPDDVEGVEWSGPRRLVLAPGAALEVSVAAPNFFYAVQMLPERTDLRMEVTVRRSAADEGTRGTVYCSPGR